VPGFDDWLQPLLVLLAALAAGAANAVAGGGTVLSFPLLVWLGLPPVEANATNSVGLWTGSLGGAWSYRGRLSGLEDRWLWLWLPALLGGGAGAWLLVNLPASWFASIAPFMVIGASVLVAVEPLVRRRIPTLGHAHGGAGKLAAVTGVFAVSAYGGYFGAGIGLLLLVSLAVLGLEDLQLANGLKNLLVVGIKGVAVAYFVVLGVFRWAPALVMIVGSTTGGWLGGFLVQKVAPATLRWIVVGIGVAMGAVMVVRTYS
jgi:hypothetical protein